MEQELNNYLDNFNYQSFLTTATLDIDEVMKKVFKDAYLLGAKSTLEFMPFYADTEDEDVWDELYAKQLAEGKLTEINK